MRPRPHEHCNGLVRFRYSCNHCSGLTRKRHQSRVGTLQYYTGMVGSRVGCSRVEPFAGGPLGNSPPPALGGVHVGTAEASYDAAVSDPSGACPTAPRVPSLAAGAPPYTYGCPLRKGPARGGFGGFHRRLHVNVKVSPTSGGGPLRVSWTTRYLSDARDSARRNSELPLRQRSGRAPHRHERGDTTKPAPGAPARRRRQRRRERRATAIAPREEATAPTTDSHAQRGRAAD